MRKEFETTGARLTPKLDYDARGICYTAALAQSPASVIATAPMMRTQHLRCRRLGTSHRAPFRLFGDAHQLRDRHTVVSQTDFAPRPRRRQAKTCALPSAAAGPTRIAKVTEVAKKETSHSQWRHAMKRERERRGLTQEALGKLVVSKPTASIVSTWEKGRTVPSDDEIWSVCRVLSIVSPFSEERDSELRWRAVAAELRRRSPRLFNAMLTFAEAALLDVDEPE